MATEISNAQKLKEAIEQKGLTEEQVSALLGKHVSKIYLTNCRSMNLHTDHLKRGFASETLSDRNLENYLHILGFTPEEIETITGTKPPCRTFVRKAKPFPTMLKGTQLLKLQTQSQTD
jgi:hypothetical protein